MKEEKASLCPPNARWTLLASLGESRAVHAHWQSCYPLENSEWSLGAKGVTALRSLWAVLVFVIGIQPSYLCPCQGSVLNMVLKTTSSISFVFRTGVGVKALHSLILKVTFILSSFIFFLEWWRCHTKFRRNVIAMEFHCAPTPRPA